MGTRFSNTDADAWFRRNAAAIAAPREDYIVGTIQRLGWAGRTFLELGCSDGSRVSRIASATRAEGHGLDLSADAIASGQERYPEVALSVGSADRTTYPNSSFDMVILGFFLTYLPPSDLFPVYAEADRLLKDGGWLVIQDWLPSRPHANPFRHRVGLKTHKFDHSRIFDAHPAYSQIHREVNLSGNDPFAAHNREGISILLKDEAGAFPEMMAAE